MDRDDVAHGVVGLDTTPAVQLLRMRRGQLCLILPASRTGRIAACPRALTAEQGVGRNVLVAG